MGFISKGYPWASTMLLARPETKENTMRIATWPALTAALSFASASLAGAAASADGTTDADKALVREVTESVFNRHDFSKLESSMAEGYVQHNPLVPQGRAGFRGYMEATFAAVPDWHYELRKISAEGDLVWTYGAYAGTPQAQWGRVPPTGKSFSMDGADIWQIKDGRIVEHWDVLDTNGMLRQLGLTPQPHAPSQPNATPAR
jgi:predicted ester cyclase